MALISCRGLSFAYGGRRCSEGVSFGVNAGTTSASWARMAWASHAHEAELLGLREPESGSIEYGDGLRRSEIGYLPQQTALQKDFPASVFEVVLSGQAQQPGQALLLFKRGQKRGRA